MRDVCVYMYFDYCLHIFHVLYTFLQIVLLVTVVLYGTISLFIPDFSMSSNPIAHPTPVPRPPIVVFAFENVKHTKDDNYSAICKHCLYNRKGYSFNKTSSSNLIRHLRTKHSLAYKEFQNFKCPPVVKAETVITPPAETVITPSAETVITSPAETVITPPAETVITPPAETVITPAEAVITPPAETVITPPAETVITPPAETVITPQAETVTTPPADTAIIPPAETITTQQVKVLNRSQSSLQLLLKRPECVSCQEIGYLKKICRTSLNSALAQCKHKTETCCCKMAAENLL